MFIPGSLLLTHCIATPGFLVAALFFAKLRNVQAAFLSIANSIAAGIALVIVIYLIIELFFAFDRTSSWPDSPGQLFFKYRAAFFLKILIVYVAAISLTFFRKLRTTVVFSLILLIVYSCLIFVEKLYLIITVFDRDTLPSSWSYYRPPIYDCLLPVALATGYSIICYFIAVKRSTRQHH